MERMAAARREERFIGAAVLGFALAYGILRAGRLRRSERKRLDRNTKTTQRSEDPQKRPF